MPKPASDVLRLRGFHLVHAVTRHKASSLNRVQEIACFGNRKRYVQHRMLRHSSQREEIQPDSCGGVLVLKYYRISSMVTCFLFVNS